MRTVFLGTSAFAGAVLERLTASPHRPALVVSRPDRPRGRGRRLSPPPVIVAATALGLEVDQPESINHPDAVARIATARPDVVCVCAYGAMISEPLLSAFAILNVHPSLLPRWRGAAPIERAIMAGDEQTGVSIMRVTAGLDSGPVSAQATEPILPRDTYSTLAARLSRLGGELLVRALDDPGRFVEQDEAAATYAEKISSADRRLDPGRSAGELERVVRALSTHIGAYVELGGETRLGVHSARGLDDGTGPPPGVVSFDGRPVLGCAHGALELVVVQPPGGRAMSGEDFVRGRRAR